MLFSLDRGGRGQNSGGGERTDGRTNGRRTGEAATIARQIGAAGGREATGKREVAAQKSDQRPGKLPLIVGLPVGGGSYMRVKPIEPSLQPLSKC